MKLVSALLLSVLFPSIAAAQNSGVFIQAGAFADALFAPNLSGDLLALGGSRVSASPTYTWSDLNGDNRWQPGEESFPVSSSLMLGLPTSNAALPPDIRRFAPGGSIAAGVFLTPSISLRVEASFQGTRVSTAESGSPFDSISVETRRESSVTDYVVAAGWHQGGTRRITIAYLAGVAFQRQREDYAYTITYQGLFRSPDGRVLNTMPILFDESIGTVVFNTGVMAGVDVPIQLSGRLAIVPQVRFVAVSHQWHLRPGVALRWNP